MGGGEAAVEHDDSEGGFRAGMVVVHTEAVDDEERVRVWEVVVGHGGCDQVYLLIAFRLSQL